MPDALSKIENLSLVLSILIFFATAEILAGFLKKSIRSKDDWIQEWVAFAGLGIIQPIIILSGTLLCKLLMPNAQGFFSSYNLFVLFIVYFLVEDFIQYSYHRFAHSNPFFWKLHRTHHKAIELGFLVSYRNAALYFLLMPSLWWMSVATFIGGGKAVAIGLIIRQLIAMTSHGLLRWDKPFYDNSKLRPVINFIERIVVTPAFHHAHHGKSAADGISNPNGNFGGTISIWDQLFGTAKFVDEYPKVYGLQNETDDRWDAQYLYPIVKSKDKTSELSPDFKKMDTSTLESIDVSLNEGQTYLWCQCGLSKNQPFCDGSHNGTKYVPLSFIPATSDEIKLCNCKKTKIGPYCDDSHLEE